MIGYHEIKKLSSEKAREVVLEVLHSNNNNVSKAARILNIQRKTVRRSRDGPLYDKSRRPINSPNKIKTDLEKIIIDEVGKTGYKYRRLYKFILLKYSININENTIKAVLKRNNVKGKKIRNRKGKSKPLYDYEHLLPFEQMQVDTKHILDFNALPKDVYMHIQFNKFPLYEYNVIDACTKTRFTAYAYEINATYGWVFIFLVIHWLRMHNIRNKINIQGDNGAEFCSGSKKKEEVLNSILNKFNASFVSIPAGKHYKQAIVENSHRHDDEQFLSIHPIRCKTVQQFMYKAQKWQDTWNTARPSWGIGMNGQTPLEKLKKKNNLISERIFQFPTLLLDNLLQKTGSYVPTNYLFLLFTKLITFFMFFLLKK